MANVIHGDDHVSRKLARRSETEFSLAHGSDLPVSRHASLERHAIEHGKTVVIAVAAQQCAIDFMCRALAAQLALGTLTDPYIGSGLPVIGWLAVSVEHREGVQQSVHASTARYAKLPISQPAASAEQAAQNLMNLMTLTISLSLDSGRGHRPRGRV